MGLTAIIFASNLLVKAVATHHYRRISYRIFAKVKENTMNLEGKVVLVTGSSQGIGRSIAIASLL
jgi:hypothetical protein